MRNHLKPWTASPGRVCEERKEGLEVSPEKNWGKNHIGRESDEFYFQHRIVDSDIIKHTLSDYG